MFGLKKKITNRHIRKTTLSDAGIIVSTNTIRIIVIAKSYYIFSVYESKKYVHVQNEYVNNFDGVFFFGPLFVGYSLKGIIEKIENFVK